MIDVVKNEPPKKFAKIKLLTGLATDRGAFNPGAEIQWEENDSLRLVEKGFAEFVETKVA